jgi:hypothetical protein
MVHWWPPLKIVSGDPKLPTKMATKLKIEKRGDEIFFKSSPLKLLSQSQPNFSEMILGGLLPKLCPALQNSSQGWPEKKIWSQ